jgi:superfamily II DNA or RNA helicase
MAAAAADNVMPALKRARVTLSGRAVVHGLSAAHRASLFEATTLQPKASASASAAPPPPLHMSVLDDAAGDIALPRQFYLAAAPLAGGGVADVTDARSWGQPMAPEARASSRIQLLRTPPQVDAVDATLAQLRGPGGAGLLVLPCGMGKTVCGAAVALALDHPAVPGAACKALVLVTDRGLAKQWANRFAHFVSGARVGVIQGKKAQWQESDVCIGMVQSFFKPNKYPAEMFAAFGTLVCDESHMMAAREMSKVVPLFSARHVLALSATPDRDDGCTDALTWLFGPTAYRCRRPWQEVRVEEVRYGGPLEALLRYGKPAHDLDVSRLVQDPVRNAFIVQRAVAAVEREGRHVMILSERTAHIMELAAAVGAARPGTSVGVYHGGLSDAERDAFLEQQYDVVVAIMKMGKQGLDKPEIDMVILATPIMRKYEQAVGRALRAFPGKDVRVPTIVDIVDPYGAFAGMARSRSRFHQAEGYVVQRYAHPPPESR